MKERDSFSGKMGFVLAAAGSAVGLGNIWRFPYLVAKYGGGIFLLVYLVLVITFGYAIMMLEISMGRKSKLGPVGAYMKFGRNYAWVGWITVLISFIISGYYSVIGGWVLKYLEVYVMNFTSAAAGDSYFGSFISNTGKPIMYQIIFIAFSGAILFGGIKGGVERVSKILMPILIVISLFIAIYTLTLPGAMEGVKYILIPDFSNFGIQTIIGALGQMFYSMSLAMGIMITFGSYLGKKDDIESSVTHVEIFDTAIAILATFMIVPAVFAFDKNMLGQGASLMFVTLPKVFNQIAFGRILGGAFFILVAFAAITSYVSILEVLIASICDVVKIKRRVAVIIAVVCSALIGLPASLGYGLWSNIKILGLEILDFMDLVANSVLLPFSALVTCIIFGWMVGLKPLEDEIALSSKFRRKRIFDIVIKYVAPIFLSAILISNILIYLGVMPSI